jgi:hypothetical protein
MSAEMGCSVTTSRYVVVWSMYWQVDRVSAPGPAADLARSVRHDGAVILAVSIVRSEVRGVPARG